MLGRAAIPVFNRFESFMSVSKRVFTRSSERGSGITGCPADITPYCETNDGTSKMLAIEGSKTGLNRRNRYPIAPLTCWIWDEQPSGIVKRAPSSFKAGGSDGQTSSGSVPNTAD
jgi:hypothetical protein